MNGKSEPFFYPPLLCFSRHYEYDFKNLFLISITYDVISRLFQHISVSGTQE